jgi:hypothetical protein
LTRDADSSGYVLIGTCGGDNPNDIPFRISITLAADLPNLLGAIAQILSNCKAPKLPNSGFPITMGEADDLGVFLISAIGSQPMYRIRDMVSDSQMGVESPEGWAGAVPLIAYAIARRIAPDLYPTPTT